MNGIRRKLRSDRGASITFALLLFLVCAMVSAVAIVAATTSAGRMSQLAQMDQRYYAVNSAAELLCDIFVGTESEPAPVLTITYKDSEVVASNTLPATADPMLRSVSEALVNKLLSSTTTTLSDDTPDKTLTLTGSADSVSLNCSIEEWIKSNGLVAFRVSNKPSSNPGANGVYTLEVTLASNLKKMPTSSTDGKMDVSWKLHSIKKIRADEKPAA